MDSVQRVAANDFVAPFYYMNTEPGVKLVVQNKKIHLPIKLYR